MDEIKAGQLSFIVSFNSICNEAGRNTLGLQETEVSVSALWHLVGTPQENKKLYKLKALLRWLHHTLMLILSVYGNHLQEALMASKRKFTGANMEGSDSNMLHFQLVSRQNHCWQDAGSSVWIVLKSLGNLGYKMKPIVPGHLLFRTASPIQTYSAGESQLVSLHLFDCQSVYSLFFF